MAQLPGFIPDSDKMTNRLVILYATRSHLLRRQVAGSQGLDAWLDRVKSEIENLEGALAAAYLAAETLRAESIQGGAVITTAGDSQGGAIEPQEYVDGGAVIV